MPNSNGNFRQIDDIPIRLRASLPCRDMSVRDLLALDEGSVVCTSRAAGDNVEIELGNKRIAHGEVIVIENSLAVRLSDLTERS